MQRTLFCLALLAAVLTTTTARAQDQVPVCGDSLCVRVLWGEGAKLMPRGEQGKAFPGPLFDVDEDRVIYLLDRLRGRILVFTPGVSAARVDTLPSLEGISFSDVSDLRVAHGKLFLLAVSDGQPFVFAWDLAARQIEGIPLRLEGQIRPPEKANLEPYKLTLGPEGLYLFQRVSQWSQKIDDGQPVPPDQQTPEEGLVVGTQRIKFQPPQGLITTVSGDPLGSGILMATGNDCILLSSKQEGQDVLEMHDLARRTLTRTNLPHRGRGPVFNTGTRYRLLRGYYEIYFDQDGLAVVKWNCPGF
jgi:hypothetical protein